MRFTSRQVVFREIPNEISLSYLISGCQKKCYGCHSTHSWSLAAGERLTHTAFMTDLTRYRRSITCVLFLGGEWHEEKLIEYLQIARSANLKTALYTGEDTIEPKLKAHLNYLKTGRYRHDLGGLDSPATNQRLYDLDNNVCLNHYFLHQGGKQNDSTIRVAAQGQA